jgi:uncharacterized protein (TIGR02246 family)
MIRVFALLACFAAAAIAGTPEQEIRKVLDDQVAAWNRGDIAAFATGYNDSPDTVFIGKTVARGYGQMVERYKKTYPTPEKMGKLGFSDLEFRILDAKYVDVIGHFHLERTDAGGGNAEGVFTLLFQKTAKGWKIIQDHTS